MYAAMTKGWMSWTPRSGCPVRGRALSPVGFLRAARTRRTRAIAPDFVNTGSMRMAKELPLSFDSRTRELDVYSSWVAC